MEKEDLLKLINDDDLGLLTVKPKNSSAITADERLVSSFQEVGNFIQENKREPVFGGNPQEHQLASRLKSIREDRNKTNSLVDFDEHGLLSGEVKEINSINDVFKDDDLGILNSADESLFDLKNVPINKERASAENVAHRKPCNDFEKYENIFKECQKDLSTGERRIVKFTNDGQVKEGTFFVMNGVLLLIDKLDEKYINKYGRWDGKQRCIFENGTESSMLFRSLVRALFKDGKLVTGKGDVGLFEDKSDVDDNDIETGFIYVVKSLSENPKIKDLENLYKIGFSTTTVEDRMKNACDDPTFLMAPVKIITTFQCYNFNAQKLEQLLHNFFGSACLNIDMFDANIRRCAPREWFVAPLDVIEKTVRLIISGEILNYRYDAVNQMIILKSK
jgi:hypothetical protein